MFTLLAAATAFVGWSAPPVSLKRTGAVRIACVGDSITAGYLASNASFAYPGRLQSLLDAKHGAGGFEVFNFGAGGATVQKGADSPYWQRDQYKQFISSTYDAVIVMLGTNDAKHQNWPMNCSRPDASAETCTVVQDYLALLDVAKTKGVGGKQPKLAVMTPPPLWKDGAYGMNQSVLNDVMPLVVPKIAAAAALPAPIDVYSALGGAPDWRKTYPEGCSPAGTAQVTPPRLAHARFTWVSQEPPRRPRIGELSVSDADVKWEHTLDKLELGFLRRRARLACGRGAASERGRSDRSGRRQPDPGVAWLPRPRTGHRHGV